MNFCQCINVRNVVGNAVGADEKFVFYLVVGFALQEFFKNKALLTGQNTCDWFKFFLNRFKAWFNVSSSTLNNLKGFYKFLFVAYLGNITFGSGILCLQNITRGIVHGIHKAFYFRIVFGNCLKQRKTSFVYKLNVYN